MSMLMRLLNLQAPVEEVEESQEVEEVSVQELDGGDILLDLTLNLKPYTLP